MPTDDGSAFGAFREQHTVNDDRSEYAGNNCYICGQGWARTVLDRKKPVNSNAIKPKASAHRSEAFHIHPMYRKELEGRRFEY